MSVDLKAVQEMEERLRTGFAFWTDAVAAQNNAADMLRAMREECVEQSNQAGLWHFEADRLREEVDTLRLADQSAQHTIKVWAASNADLRQRNEALEKQVEVARHKLETGRVWGGMGWSWNPVRREVAQEVWGILDAALRQGGGDESA